MTIIAPSILAMDFSKLDEQLHQVNNSKATYLHFDVMDGHFVPNITFGPDILRGIAAASDLVMDVHLMISDPLKYSEIFIKNGADHITFHVESLDLEKGLGLVNSIHNLGKTAGITLKPNTRIEDIIPYLEVVDMVLIMSVEPGFGGQSFMVEMLDKVRFVANYRQEQKLSYLIEIDGGIDDKTALLAKEAGVDILVAGSYIFNHPKGIIPAIESLL